MIDTDSAVKTVNTSSNANTTNAGEAAARSISFMQLWRREWQVKQQGTVQWLYPLVLFLVIITLFPLAVGSEPALLQRLGVSAPRVHRSHA